MFPYSWQSNIFSAIVVTVCGSVSDKHTNTNIISIDSIAEPCKANLLVKMAIMGLLMPVVGLIKVSCHLLALEWFLIHDFSRLDTGERRLRLTLPCSSCTTGPPPPSSSSAVSWWPAMISLAPPSPVSMTMCLAMFSTPTAGSCPHSQYPVSSSHYLAVTWLTSLYFSSE